MFNGVLVIDKPTGITSHDVVNRLRKALGTKKIGHTGTLDPLATGVLVMLVGKATRLANLIDSGEKEYLATIAFGFETDTGDLTGERKDESGFRDPSGIETGEFGEAIAEFTGEIEQIPPMYSAKKVSGRKLYELAREGKEIAREPITVTISDLELISLTRDAGSRTAKIRVVCSAGTYIRTLAEDIARRLGTRAHLVDLRRTRAGSFTLDAALTLEEIEKPGGEGVTGRFVPMAKAVERLPSVDLDNESVDPVRHGRAVDHFAEGVAEGGFVRMMLGDGELAAIGIYDATRREVKPKIVMI